MEVSAATTQTLDLDQLLGHVAGDRTEGAAVRSVRPSCSTVNGRRDLRIRYALGHRDDVVRIWRSRKAKASRASACGPARTVLGRCAQRSENLNTVDAVRTELAVP